MKDVYIIHMNNMYKLCNAEFVIHKFGIAHSCKNVV